jgi:hypothetical protein
MASRPAGKQRLLHYTFALALLQARGVHEHAGSLTELVEQTLSMEESAGVEIDHDVMEVQLHLGVRYHSAIYLWFATLFCAVDFWQRYGFQDDAVDSLIANNPHLEILQDLRNAVFHPTPANDPVFKSATAAFESIEEWTREFYETAAEYTRGWFRREMPATFKDL